MSPHCTPARRGWLAAVLLLTAAAAPSKTPPPPPGVVVTYSPPQSKIYVGSPGIVRLTDGTLLAKCDEFGAGSTEYATAVSPVFRSKDGGQSWTPAARVRGVYWASIFEHAGAVYMVGVHHVYGPITVVKSTDGGTTWTYPTDGKTGLIRPGKWHTAPVPVIEHDGRLWRGIEDADGPGGWGVMYHPHLISIPVGGDLLDASQWTVSDAVPRDGGWLGGEFKWVLEGNAVVDRKTDRVLDILRSDHADLAAVATAADGGKRLVVDPSFDRMPFVGTDKKLQIRYDEPSHQYFALANPAVAGGGTGDQRNTLALYASADLRGWTLRSVLLHHPDAAKHAFQYADWVADGDDLLVASRTAWDGPDGLPWRGHDANYLTFHRFHNFRTRTMADGPTVTGLTPLSKHVGPLTLTGTGFDVGTLADGKPAFTNRPYVWADVPAALRGAAVTRGAGGFAGTITVAATDGPAELIILTAGDTAGVDLSAYTPVPTGTFHYTDGGRTPAHVYKRSLAKGERVTVPQGNWAGVHLLVPPTAGEKP